MQARCKILLLAIFWVGAAINIILAAEPSSDTALRPPAAEYKASAVRDPFKAKALDIKKFNETPVDKRPLPKLNVQGLVWGGNTPQAIIDNKVVKIGDIIQGMRIVAITKEGVTVNLDKEEYIISVPLISDIGASSKNSGGEDAK